MPADAMQEPPLRNWAGNHRDGTSRITSATSVPQVQAFVRKHAHFKVIGTRHCFNGIAGGRRRSLGESLLQAAQPRDSLHLKAGVAVGPQASPLR